MGAQAFLYNAIFFTYALVLTRYYGVRESQVGLFLLPFAAGNFLGPLVLGPLFDQVGRRIMITVTYALTGALIILTGLLFKAGLLSPIEQTLAWSVVFFVASAAASSAYLTVGECFPLEVRASAIAWFYALGTALGGIAGPIIFGHLIAAGTRDDVFVGYALGGVLMLAAAVVAVFLPCLPNAARSKRLLLRLRSAKARMCLPVKRDRRSNAFVQMPGLRKRPLQGRIADAVSRSATRSAIDMSRIK